MKIKVYTLNAFGKEIGGGNSAGVVLDADYLSEEQMKKVAFKVGFSETAFVGKSQKGDYKLRFFTPKDEVDLCGHATIATFALLKEKGIIKIGSYKQETKSGILEIQLMEDNKVYMNQTIPKFYGTIEKSEIAKSLKIDEGSISSTMPIEIVSTGLKDILVPINDLSTLLSMKPDFDEVSRISEKYGVIGYHAFTLETMNLATAHCRNFAPLYNIPEEAATGTSNGALSCYLFKNKILREEAFENLIFEQGYIMNKPSEIIGKLEFKNGEINNVMVGGSASSINEIEVDI